MFEKVDVLLTYADITEKKGKYKEELTYCKEALEYFQKGLMANLPNFIDTSVYSNPKLENVLSKPILLSSLTSKASALYQLFKHETKAYSDLEASISTYEMAFQLTNIMRNEYNIESAKLLLSESTKNNYAKAVYTAMEFDNTNQPPASEIKTFNFIEKGKSATLTALFNESNAIHMAGIPDSLIDLEKKLKREINFLKTNIDQEKYKKEGYDTLKVNELENGNFSCSRKLDSLVLFFETTYPAYYELKYANKTVTIPEIQMMQLMKTGYYMQGKCQFRYKRRPCSFKRLRNRCWKTVKGRGAIGTHTGVYLFGNT